MSHTAVRDSAWETGFPSDASDGAIGSEADLSPEIAAALIDRAKEIIAGRVCPPAPVASPEIEKFLQREFEGVEPSPTPEAIRRITEGLSLQALYRGQPVVCFKMKSGALAVLASGEREIEALLRGLPESESSRVYVTDFE